MIGQKNVKKIQYVIGTLLQNPPGYWNLRNRILKTFIYQQSPGRYRLESA